MPDSQTILIAATALAAVLWTFWALAAHKLLQNPWNGPAAGVLYRWGQFYAKAFHKLRVENREHIPQTRTPGALILIANHTAGIDPVLIQAACPFPIRWVMAEDMRMTRYEAFWNWQRIIFVDRNGASAAPLREAIRHVKEGGVLGIFPEGGLERPPRSLRPFEEGVGMIVRRTKAPVLPVIIEGTPQVESAWASLWTPSRARVTFSEPVTFSSKASAAEITASLREHYKTATGWPDSQDPADDAEPTD